MSHTNTRIINFHKENTKLCSDLFSILCILLLKYIMLHVHPGFQAKNLLWIHTGTGLLYMLWFIWLEGEGGSFFGYCAPNSFSMSSRLILLSVTWK